METREQSAAHLEGVDPHLVARPEPTQELEELNLAAPHVERVDDVGDAQWVNLSSRKVRLLGPAGTIPHVGCLASLTMTKVRAGF